MGSFPETYIDPVILGSSRVKLMNWVEPASKLFGALWRRGGKRKERLQLATSLEFEFCLPIPLWPRVN